MFLRNDDLAGLTKYYEQWLAKNPRDLEAIARLARTLSSQGQAAEASKWLRARARRRADQQRAAAGAHRSIGLTSGNSPPPRRNTKPSTTPIQTIPTCSANGASCSCAIPADRRPIASRPPSRSGSDCSTTSRTMPSRPLKWPISSARAGLTDDAITLYKKAVELAPASAQYREYLGEYLHSLKRSDEALATWRPMAEGANRTAKNLARLSEVLAGFGYRKEAIESLAESLKTRKRRSQSHSDVCRLVARRGPPRRRAGPARHGRQAGQQCGRGRVGLAGAAQDLSSDRHAHIPHRGVAEAARCRRGGDRRALASTWPAITRPPGSRRRRTAAISKALEKDPKSIAILSSAARIHESGGNFLAAADTFRKLAGIDRRFRTEHLTAVAKLEQRLGRREQAIQAGRDLLAAAPGNPEHHKFFADLCFQLGDPEEGLESLRRSVRANPSDPEGLLTLAQALANRQRPGEAIELLWRALDKTDDLDGKLSVIGRLAELYLTSNQFDRLLERLEHQRREADKTREFTLCIAQAYQRAGDISAARQELERLLTEQSRDTALLFQLSQLAESESDLAAATKYQRRVVAVIPNNHDAQLRLAQLLVRNGESDEAAEIWVKLVADEPEPHRNLLAIDQLIANRKFETVLAITSRLLAQKPGDWELIYREAASLAALDRRAEAASRFQAILALKLSDDAGRGRTQVRKEEKTYRDQRHGDRRGQCAEHGLHVDEPTRIGIRRPAVAADQRGEPAAGVHRPRAALNYAYSQQFRGWAPRDYGQARMASLGWLLGFSAAGNSQQAFISSYRPSKAQRANDPRRLWDWYYLQLVRQDSARGL